MNNKSLLGPLGISLAAIAVVAVALVMYLPPLVSAMVQPTGNEADHNERVQLLVERHAAETALFRDRFEGRSPFFIPDAPAPLPPEPTDPPPPPVQVDKGPHPTYGGSLTNPTAILGDTVFFKDGSSIKRVKPGEVYQGARLVEIKPPYTVVVAWTAPSTPTARYEEGTYELRLMEQTIERDGGPISFTRPDSSSLPRGITEAESVEEDRVREANKPPNKDADRNDDVTRRRSRPQRPDENTENDDGMSEEERQQADEEQEELRRRLQEQEMQREQQEAEDANDEFPDEESVDDADAEPMPDD